MRSWRSLIGLTVSLTCLGVLLGAQETGWRWPLEEGAISENYSGNVPFPLRRRGEPPVIHGMRLTSESPEVFPLGPGEPIYISPPSDGGMNRVIPPLGGWIALEHPGGIRSMYGHLEPESPYGADPARPLGYLDGSGAQLGRALHFSLFDQRTGQSVNPRLLLPEQPDRFRPVVEELRLYSAGDPRLIWSSETPERIVREGTVTLVAYVYDRHSATDRFAPYQVTIFANGAQVIDETWDVRRVWQEIELIRGGEEAALAVRGRNVTLVDGENRIEVVARDFRGNIEERTFTLLRQAP